MRTLDLKSNSLIIKHNMTVVCTNKILRLTYLRHHRLACRHDTEKSLRSIMSYMIVVPYHTALFRLVIVPSSDSHFIIILYILYFMVVDVVVIDLFPTKLNYTRIKKLFSSVSIFRN